MMWVGLVWVVSSWWAWWMLSVWPLGMIARMRLGPSCCHCLMRYRQWFIVGVLGCVVGIRGLVRGGRCGWGSGCF